MNKNNYRDAKCCDRCKHVFVHFRGDLACNINGDRPKKVFDELDMWTGEYRKWVEDNLVSHNKVCDLFEE